MSSPFQIAANRETHPAWQQSLRETEAYAAKQFPDITPGADGKAPDPVTAARWLKTIAGSTAIDKHKHMADVWSAAVVMPSDLYYDAKHGFVEAAGTTRTGIIARPPTPGTLARVDFVALLNELHEANASWGYGHFNNIAQAKVSSFAA